MSLNSMFGSIATRFDAFGYVKEILDNPNEDGNTLVNDLAKYSRFLYDPHVASCIQSRKSGVLSMNWEIIHSDNDTPVTKFINDVFSWLDIRKIISHILDAPLYGYKPLEIYWDYEGEYLVPMDVIGKPSWWFHFTKNQFLYFKKSQETNYGTALPRYKFLLAQHNDSYDNPYGEAVLAKCYMPLIFKRGGFELWAQYIQKYGMPYLWASVSSANDEDIKSAVSALQALKQDGAAAASETINTQLLDGSSGGSSQNYLEFVHFCNAEISKAILSQTLTTEQGATGSYAMSQTHLQVRKDVVESDAKLVESTLNRLIEYIVELNFAEVDVLPKFSLYGELEADLTLARRDQILFSSGFVKPTKEYLIRHHNFKEDEIEMIEQAPQPAFAESAVPEETDDLDSFTQSIIKDMVAMIKSGKSYSEIEDKILEYLPDISTEKLEKFFSDALITVQASGMISGAK